jgi:RNA polymerase sigma factor (sigma-70 family)
MGNASLTARAPAARPFRSKRLLALAGDDRLVEQIRRGNDIAFEVAFERHGAGILAFCRHMLGSREDAEDAVQHTFAAAHRDLQRGAERKIALRPWLYTIARNRCLSVLRARREQAAELEDVPTEGLSDEVERRAELRELLGDMRELPEDQRAALLLSEAAGMSHGEVAEVLGCETGSVKGLVFRARSGLIERREARLVSCSEIREQLATLRGGALRRNELRHHLRRCPGCSAYRDEVRRQRQMLSAALPVVPSLGLKSNVLAAAGLGGGAAGGGVAAGGLAGSAALGSLGSSAVAKVAMVGVLAAGGAAAGGTIVEGAIDDHVSDAVVAPDPAGAAGKDSATGEAGPRGQGELISAERSRGLRGLERRSERSRGRGPKSLSAPNRTRAKGERGARGENAGRRTLGQGKRAERTGGNLRDKATPKAKSPSANGSPQSRAQGSPQPQRRPAPQAKVLPKVEVTPPAQSAPAPVPQSAPAPKAPSVEKVKPLK